MEDKESLEIKQAPESEENQEVKLFSETWAFLTEGKLPERYVLIEEKFDYDEEIFEILLDGIINNHPNVLKMHDSLGRGNLIHAVLANEEFSINKRLDYVEQMVRHGASVAIPDDKGLTLIHYLLETGKFKTFSDVVMTLDLGTLRRQGVVPILPYLLHSKNGNAANYFLETVNQIDAHQLSYFLYQPDTEGNYPSEWAKEDKQAQEILKNSPIFKELQDIGLIQASEASEAPEAPEAQEAGNAVSFRTALWEFFTRIAQLVAQFLAHSSSLSREDLNSPTQSLLGTTPTLPFISEKTAKTSDLGTDLQALGKQNVQQEEKKLISPP